MLLRAKKLILALCVVGVSGSIFATPVLVKSEQDIYEYKLDNGLHVVLAPNQKENKVYMNTIYFTGALNDPQGKGGLAHLLEHLAFKGTKNVQGDEFQRQLDQYTLSHNASTDYYSTRYLNIVRPEQAALDHMIYLEAERMDKLVLKEQYVPTEIEIVRREREIRLDQPFSVLIDQILKSAYGNQSLGRLPIGDLAELKSIQLPELEAFYRSYYAPNNAVMVIAGRFDVEKTLASIDKQFSGIQSRDIPAKVMVPQLNSSQLEPRAFKVEKGSDLAKFNIYVSGKKDESDVQTILALTPYFFTMQPSGHLYQNMVEAKTTTDVSAFTWLAQDFNLVFLGAIYAPNHDANKIENALVQNIEQAKPFTMPELNRVKNLVKNEYRNLFSSSVDVGSLLSTYIVSQNRQWQKFFEDQKTVQNLSVDQVNQVFQDFLVPENRVLADIKPTPEDQKKAIVADQSTSQAAIQEQVEKQEELKDPSVYKQEIQEYVKKSAQLLGTSEEKIQRGKLRNSIQYALFPTETRDDRIYATLELDVGNEQSLFNKSSVIDLTTYLLLRGSNKYTLQDIADKSIQLDGTVIAESQLNSITINISANKDTFNQYFDFVIDLLKNPKFDQREFDLIKAQSLQNLDRPYTEPETVAGLVLSEAVEKYQAGDLRYHFEPELAKKELLQVTNDQIKDFYKTFFETHHARISITGEFDDKELLKQLKKSFGSWTTKQNYSPILAQYDSLKAQNIHALAEQREFGYYQSVLNFPVGVFNKDSAALIVFSHILGNSQLSSRLAMELREKNALVYGFGSQLSLNDKVDVGSLTIAANYTAGRSDQVSKGVHKVLQDLLSRGVTEQELEAAKADIMKQRSTILEDQRNVHRMLNSQLDLNKTMASRAQRDLEIAKLTVDDVNVVIKKYIKIDGLVEVMADQYGKVQ